MSQARGTEGEVRQIKGLLIQFTMVNGGIAATNLATAKLDGLRVYDCYSRVSMLHRHKKQQLSRSSLIVVCRRLTVPSERCSRNESDPGDADSMTP